MKRLVERRLLMLIIRPDDLLAAILREGWLVGPVPDDVRLTTTYIAVEGTQIRLVLESDRFPKSLQWKGWLEGITLDLKEPVQTTDPLVEEEPDGATTRPESTPP